MEQPERKQITMQYLLNWPLESPLTSGKRRRVSNFSLVALLLAQFCVCTLRASDAHATVDVWVDFTSDFHNGSNGPSNGVADWIDELNDATGAVSGVADFNATERAQIENNIVANLEIIFADYEFNFVTEEPAGEHDVIYMARDNDHPDVSSTNRGSAPVDIGNQDTNGYTDRDGNPSGVPKVTTGNFENDLEASDPRATQIAELSTALSGTAAHELGHTMGLLHHYVYSHPDISPANYANTGGVQNVHILASGNTGLSESEREQLRSLSPFSRVMLDITGGSDASSFEENNTVVVGGIVSDRTENEGTDAGNSIFDAQPLSFSTGPTSGQEISFVEADLDGSRSDVDVFSFTTTVDSVLQAHVFSERLDLGSLEFDPVLELIDEFGSTLMSVDDIGWDDDQYNDLISPEDDDDDPFLLNIPLDPGTYYLRVLATMVDISDTPNVGDNYWLITALQLEEPSPNPPDYDGDGDVDLVDLGVWQNSFGIDAIGDTDNDGDTDGADFLSWQRAASNSVGGSVAAVPEPVASGLIALAIGFLVCSRRPETRDSTSRP